MPALTFQLMYCFFVIEHGQRRILHFTLTPHPTAEWVVQQLREAFPEALPIATSSFDRDARFDLLTAISHQALGDEVPPRRLDTGPFGCQPRCFQELDDFRIVGSCVRARATTMRPHPRFAGKRYAESGCTIALSAMSESESAPTSAEMRVSAKTDPSTPRPQHFETVSLSHPLSPPARGPPHGPALWCLRSVT